MNKISQEELWPIPKFPSPKLDWERKIGRNMGKKKNSSISQVGKNRAAVPKPGDLTFD